MEQKFIMTAFGKDRPGIVADVSQLVYENGCNLEDSTMALMADQFTIMLLLAGQGNDLEERLSNACRRLEIEKGVSAFLRRVDDSAPQAAGARTTRTVHVEGLDKAGIVYRISRFLADRGVNIVTLDSRMNFTPESGAAIYSMKISVHVPEDVSLDELADGLSEIGDQLNVDVSID